MPRVLIVWALVAGTIACADRNDDCQWQHEGSQKLNLRNAADAEHLREDIELVEDLSIRYGDVRWGPGPTRQRGREEQCLAPLFDQIARRHSLSVDDVVAVRGTLDQKGANLVVNVPAVLFFALITWFMLHWIYARFSVHDELLAIAAASLLAALAAGGATVAFGRMWEGAFDMLRLGNDHLSYRGLRRQWIQFAPAFFVLGTISFWLIAFGVGWWKVWSRKAAGHAV